MVNGRLSRVLYPFYTDTKPPPSSRFCLRTHRFAHKQVISLSDTLLFESYASNFDTYMDIGPSSPARVVLSLAWQSSPLFLISQKYLHPVCHLRQFLTHVALKWYQICGEQTTFTCSSLSLHWHQLSANQPPTVAPLPLYSSFRAWTRHKSLGITIIQMLRFHEKLEDVSARWVLLTRSFLWLYWSHSRLHRADHLANRAKTWNYSGYTNCPSQLPLRLVGKWSHVLKSPLNYS